MSDPNQLDSVLTDTAECLEEIADQLQEHVDSMRAGHVQVCARCACAKNKPGAP